MFINAVMTVILVIVVADTYPSIGTIIKSLAITSTGNGSMQ